MKALRNNIGSFFVSAIIIVGAICICNTAYAAPTLCSTPQDISSPLRQAEARFSSGNVYGAMQILSQILDKYPNNTEAKDLMDKCKAEQRNQYNEAIASNSIDKLRAFQKSYPESEYWDYVDRMIRDLPLWLNAMSIGSIEAYNEYKDKSSEKLFVTKADAAIRDLNIESSWASAKASNTIDAYKDFLTEYGDSKYERDASNRIARLMADEFTSKSLLSNLKTVLSYARNGMTQDYVKNKFYKAKGKKYDPQAGIDLTSSIVDVSFETNPDGAKVLVDDQDLGETPHVETFEFGTYSLSIKKKNHFTVHKSITIDSTNKEFKYNLRPLQSPNAFYIGVGGNVGGLMGVSANIGCYLKNFNIEIQGVYGLMPSETIYWNNPETMKKPTGYKYKSMALYGKLGYGITIGTNFRITPQLGAGIVQLKGSAVENGIEDPMATSAYCVPAIVDVKFDYAIAQSFGVFLTPGYSFAVMKSGLYDRMASASKSIKGLGTGFEASAGIYIFF